MQKKTVVAVIAGVFIGAIGSPVAVAQFAVIDVAAIVKLKDQIVTANSILDTSNAIFDKAKTHLQAFQTNATALKTKNWLSYVRSIKGNSTQNRFGETAGIQQAMNQALNVSTAWQKATMDPGNASFLSSYIPGKSTHLAHLATIEMQDSAGQTAIAALGDYRSTDAQSQTAYSQLELDVASTSPTFNTEAAQLNLSNAIAIQHLKQQRAATAVNAALLEQQLAANKYQRDATAGHIQMFDSLKQSQGASDGWKFDPTGPAVASRWLVP